MKTELLVNGNREEEEVKIPSDIYIQRQIWHQWSQCRGHCAALGECSESNIYKRTQYLYTTS